MKSIARIAAALPLLVACAPRAPKAPPEPTPPPGPKPAVSISKASKPAKAPSPALSSKPPPMDWLAMGGSVTCMSQRKGRYVTCWGDIPSLDLGAHPVTADHRVRVKFAAPVKALAITDCACALLDTGKVQCWGAKGRCPFAPNTAPTTVAGLSNVVSVGVGDQQACVLFANGHVRCWGRNDHDQCGIPDKHDGNAPDAARNPNVKLGGKAVKLSVGLWHSCALMQDGAVRCWGENDNGQLGYGGPLRGQGRAHLPGKRGEVPLELKATDISAGWENTCAILTDGTVRCWGMPATACDSGDCGLPSADQGYTLAFHKKVAQLAAGRMSCVLLIDGSVHCWMQNGGEQVLGYPQYETSDDVDPKVGIDLGGPVKSLALSVYNRACALRRDGNVLCWGKNGPHHPLGYARTDDIGDNETPAQVGPLKF